MKYLVGIGPGRAGTSFLYDWLRVQDWVATAKRGKETEYFSKHYSRGPSWYTNQFQTVQSLPPVGVEISTMYIQDASVAPRMVSSGLDVYCLVTLRDPVERLESVVAYRQRAGTLPSQISIPQAVAQHPELIAECQYERLLPPFLSQFPTERVAIHLFKDIIDAPDCVVRSLMERLAVTGEVAAPTSTFRNARAKARVYAPPRVIRLLTDLARTVGMHSLVDQAKRQPALRRLLLSDEHQERGATQAYLRARYGASHYTRTVDFVESLLDRDLAAWRAGWSEAA